MQFTFDNWVYAVFVNKKSNKNDFIILFNHKNNKNVTIYNKIHRRYNTLLYLKLYKSFVMYNQDILMHFDNRKMYFLFIFFF